MEDYLNMHQTNAAIEAEQTLGSGKVEIDEKLYNNIDDYINNKPIVILPEGIKVGDFVNYEPTTGEYTVSSKITGYTKTTEQTFKNRSR